MSLGEVEGGAADLGVVASGEHGPVAGQGGQVGQLAGLDSAPRVVVVGGGRLPTDRRDDRGAGRVEVLKRRDHRVGNAGVRRLDSDEEISVRARAQEVGTG